MNQLDDDLLQRYYDGDLSPTEAAVLQVKIAADPESQAQLMRIARLGQMVRLSVDEMSADLDSAALFADITRGIDDKRNTVRPLERAQVLSGEWLEHRRGRVIAFVASLAVAAAALVIWAAPRQQDAVAHVPTPRVQTPEPEPALVEGAELAVADVHGSRVEEVDFGTNTGTVFEIDNQGVPTAVVWISEE